MTSRSFQQLGLLVLGIGILAALWLPGLNKDSKVKEKSITTSVEEVSHDHAEGESHSSEGDKGVYPDSYNYAISLAEKASSEGASSKITSALMIDSVASLMEDEKLTAQLNKRTEQLLNDALKLEPENKDALNNLAMIDIYLKEDVMNGVQKLLKVVRIDNNNEMALYQLGILAVKSGQTDKAIERFEKLVSLQPQNKEYHKNLALLYSQKGNTSKAERHAALAK